MIPVNREFNRENNHQILSSSVNPIRKILCEAFQTSHSFALKEKKDAFTGSHKQLTLLGALSVFINISSQASQAGNTITPIFQMKRLRTGDLNNSALSY